MFDHSAIMSRHNSDYMNTLYVQRWWWVNASALQFWLLWMPAAKTTQFFV